MERIRGRKLQRRRRRIFAREPLCRICRERGFTVAAVELDHIVPLHLGGSDTDESNLQPVCDDCHAEKTAEEQRAGWGRKPRPSAICVHGDFTHLCEICQ